MGRRGWRVTRISVGNFLSHSAAYFVRVNHCWFIGFGYRKSLWITGEAEITILRRNCFFSVPKHFEGESSNVSLNSSIEKGYREERVGGNHDFPLKLICLAGLENFVEETFCAVFP